MTDVAPMGDNRKAHIYGLIEEIAAAEKITKVKLATLSRDILLYVVETDDIDSVNRLIGVLTSWHKKAAVPYFTHFLPWEVERDSDKKFQRFGKRMKGNKLTKKRVLIEKWLENPDNCIWNWADQNLEVKQLDLNARVKNAINKALNGDEKTDTDPLTPEQVVMAIFQSELTMEQMLEGLEGIKQANEKAELEVMEPANKEAA